MDDWRSKPMIATLEAARVGVKTLDVSSPESEALRFGRGLLIGLPVCVLIWLVLVLLLALAVL
jgi:hypothetical protein